MSLKIIKFEPRLGRIVLIAAALLCVITAWFFIKWNFANAVSSRLDTKRAEFKPVADWLTQMAPSDPQTHLTAARIYQKTFDPGDLTRSLSEYESAAALSPYNYLAWIDLGKARSLNGDTEGAQAAYARALQLAPNYAPVQWACGNSLIRQGKNEEGFALIAKAAAANSDYAQPAVTTALQIFDNDLGQVQRSLGDNDVTNAALAGALANQLQFEAAFTAWSKLSEGDRGTKFKKLGDDLIEKFAAARKFSLAAGVASGMRTNEGEKPTVGQVSNGGFEAGVKIRNAALFEWQIAEGAQPQIALSETETHGGKYSLWLIFNSFETAAFRSVSQTVAVVPGAEYEFEAFYRSDLKTTASIKWEIVNALTNAPIAATLAAVPAPDWMPLRVRFMMPADSDGVIVRLVREGCNGPSCPTNGSMAFDDISLRRL
ncbi:MAG: hypothetical protein IPL32_06565 [Chloracidobacterium sp.]|nr:hypothetical protein [Chloracidobacterium sp.]